MRNCASQACLPARGRSVLAPDQGFTPLVGVVLATTNQEVKLGFALGQVWVPRCLIQEDTFVIGSVQTFHIAAWLVTLKGLIS